MRVSKTWLSAAGCLLLAVSTPPVQAQQKSGDFLPSAGATIFQDFPDGNSGGYDRVCIGNEVANKLRRGFINYDLSEIPPGSKITRVVLNMEQFRVRFTGPGAPKSATLHIHRVQSAWNQGVGQAENSFFNTYTDDECGIPPAALEGEMTWNNAPPAQEDESVSLRLPAELSWPFTFDTDDGNEFDGLLDDVQVQVNRGASHGWQLSVAFENISDNARLLTPGVLTVEWDETDAFPVVINPGMNDAWYNPLTDGQGIFTIVYPSIPLVFLAWFTYEIDAPADGSAASLNSANSPYPELTALLGDDQHRWLTAAGPFEGNRALLDISITRGGKFDAPDPVQRENDGTIELIFEDCEKLVAKYHIASLNKSGEIPLQRVANDNVPLCEAFSSGTK